MKKRCNNFTIDVINRRNCAAGINVRELVGGDDFGWLMRTPCVSTHKTAIKCDKCEFPSTEEELEWKRKADKALENASKAIKQTVIKCDKCEFPSTEEELEWKRKADKALDNVSKAIKQIREITSIKCPACGNILRFSVAQGNNHISGRCDTEGCLRWMM